MKNPSKPKQKSVPPTEDYQECPPGVIFTFATLTRLYYHQKKPADPAALYGFYCYTTLWQKTLNVWATTEYTAKAMGWSVEKLRRVKKKLIEMGLIRDIRSRTKDQKHFGKCYIQVRYSVTHGFRQPFGKPTPLENVGVEKTGGKCLDIRKNKCLDTRSSKNGGTASRLMGGTSSSKNSNGKLTTFALRWGVKIQHKLKIQGSYTTKDHQVHHSPVKSTTWAKEIQYILHSMHIDRDTFKSIMSWYLKEGYKLPPPQAPRLFRVKDLVDKWPALAHAYERSRAAADTGIRYRQGADGEYGYYDDSLDA